MAKVFLCFVLFFYSESGETSVEKINVFRKVKGSKDRETERKLNERKK